MRICISLPLGQGFCLVLHSASAQIIKKFRAVQALKSRNAKGVKMVAFDASEQLMQDCRDGWIDSLVVQNPFKMG